MLVTSKSRRPGSGTAKVGGRRVNMPAIITATSTMMITIPIRIVRRRKVGTMALITTCWTSPLVASPRSGQVERYIRLDEGGSKRGGRDNLGWEQQPKD